VLAYQVDAAGTSCYEIGLVIVMSLEFLEECVPSRAERVELVYGIHFVQRGGIRDLRV
jgi:hypothetical protein